MNKIFLTVIAVCLITFSVPVKAFTPVLSDAPQFAQKVLMNAQNVLSTTQAYVKAANAYKTLILKGYAGVMQLTNLDRWKQLFMSNLNKQVQGITHSIENDLRAALGNDISALVTREDLANMNLEAFQQWGEKKLTAMTESELRNILGPNLAGKLTVQQIRSIINNPQNAQHILSTLFSAAEQTKKSANGLEGLGIKGMALADTTKTTGRGSDGNRSDAFNGTGNGSTAQAAASVEAFTAAREKIEKNMQLPKTQKELNEITPAQLVQITLLQTEAVKETAARGLSKAWIRQAAAKQRNKMQEDELAAMTNELMTDQGIDMRKIVKLAYTGASMTVEMQNYMSAVFASDLAAYATQTNMRSGGTVTAVLSDGKETPRELTSADQIAKNLGISDTASTGAGTSAGDGEVVFKSVLERLVDIFKNLRSVIYVLGGFGLIGFAFAAIFNKLSWSWFAAVAIALLTLGLAGAVVDYVTQTTQSTAFEAGELGDTLSGKKE